jgi:hypothetical protein
MGLSTGLVMNITNADNGSDPWITINNYPSYGIRYFNSTTDKLAISASGNADNVSTADLCINGNGDGTVTMRGKNILHTGTAYIKNGVITINGTSITPLTSHQSLANYVTLNTTQTITGSKIFTASTNTFSGTGATMLTIDRNSTNPAWIRFCKNGTLLGYIGIDNNYNPTYLSGQSGAAQKIILHSGNYTSYLPILNSASTHATNTSVIYAPSTAGTKD